MHVGIALVAKVGVGDRERADERREGGTAVHRVDEGMFAGWVPSYLDRSVEKFLGWPTPGPADECGRGKSEAGVVVARDVPEDLQQDLWWNGGCSGILKGLKKSQFGRFAGDMGVRTRRRWRDERAGRRER